TEIKAGEDHEGYPQNEHPFFLFLQIALCSYKGQTQKRHIVYKHDLIIRVKNQRSCQSKHTSRPKADIFPGKLLFYPMIEQHCRNPVGRHTADHYIQIHGHKMQQVRKQHYSTEKSVIRKIVNILSPAQIPGYVREKISRGIKSLAEIIRQHTVLAHPVYPGAENPILENKKPAEQQSPCK